MFEQFQKRSTQLERLDTGDYTAKEYARWQREMKFIHALFGEQRALKKTLFRDIKSDGEPQFSVLDVGAGSGGLLRELKKWTSHYNAFLVGAELDGTAARSINDGTIVGLQCDALQLPFADKSFEYVFCSLFLHHLDDDPAIRLLQEMARVAAKRIYVIDLNRHPTAYYAYKVFGWPFLQPFTLEDGALSILRSRTPEELGSLAKRARLRNVKVEHSRANRLILTGN